MMRARRRIASGFTMVELMVVIAVAVVLIGLLAWGVSKVRAAANQATCINNMRQIGLAVQGFHENNGKFPTYNGIFPYSTNTSQAGNPKAVYGSYLVHLLPYLDKPTEYKAILADVRTYTNTGKPLTTLPPTGGSSATSGVISVPAVPGTPAVYNLTGLTYVPAIPAVPATYNNWNATKVGTVVLVASPSSTNGATVWVGTVQWSPPQTPDPGTGPSTGVAAHYVNAAGTTVVPQLITPATPGTPAVYSVQPTPAIPGTPGRSTYTSTFKSEIRSLKNTVLLCPADPSPGTDPNAPSVGVLYPTSGGIDYWAPTNYVANWNTISVPDPTAGYKAAPQDKSAISDGLSNTILLAEAYAYCDGKGRTAFIAWHENDPTANVPNGGAADPSTPTVPYGGVHNFGLTYQLQSNKIQAGTRPPVTVIAPNGYPNPYGSPELIFEFQQMPLTLPFAQCPPGANCCNAFTVQSGHPSGMNVTMADGSVRTLHPDLPLNTWRSLLLPNDGQAISGDW
jgi:prepilin-type N-terminal cleavage/methylation domain-containing protein/prepilin-type processing-associated H-X9-DG protein